MKILQSSYQMQIAVVIIERNKDRCKAIESEIDAPILNVNKTIITTLKDVEVESADIFIASTDSEKINLFGSLLARRWDAKGIIIRLRDPAKEEVFESIGIDPVVNPEVAAAVNLEKLVMRAC